VASVPVIVPPTRAIGPELPTELIVRVPEVVSIDARADVPLVPPFSVKELGVAALTVTDPVLVAVMSAKALLAEPPCSVAPTAPVVVSTIFPVPIEVMVAVQLSLEPPAILSELALMVVSAVEFWMSASELVVIPPPPVMPISPVVVMLIGPLVFWMRAFDVVVVPVPPVIPNVVAKMFIVPDVDKIRAVASVPVIVPPESEMAPGVPTELMVSVPEVVSIEARADVPPVPPVRVVVGELIVIDDVLVAVISPWALSAEPPMRATTPGALVVIVVAKPAPELRMLAAAAPVPLPPMQVTSPSDTTVILPLRAVMIAPAFAPAALGVPP
jgi:hypothetical protein